MATDGLTPAVQTIGSPTHEADTLAPLQVRAKVYTDVAQAIMTTELPTALQGSTSLVVIEEF